MQMAIQGHDATTIAHRCGIARAEADLVVALARNRQEGFSRPRADPYAMAIREPGAPPAGWRHPGRGMARHERLGGAAAASGANCAGNGRCRAGHPAPAGWRCGCSMA
jgi:hypothetical protein